MDGDTGREGLIGEGITPSEGEGRSGEGEGVGLKSDGSVGVC